MVKYLYLVVSFCVSSVGERDMPGVIEGGIVESVLGTVQEAFLCNQHVGTVQHPHVHLQRASLKGCCERIHSPKCVPFRRVAILPDVPLHFFLRHAAPRLDS